MPLPWRDWYHCTMASYGQWLRGDPRGWRERNHRHHVEGDYKHPPQNSNFNDAAFDRSKKLLKHQPMFFTPAQRRDVGLLALQSLSIQAIRVIALAAGAKHLHTVIQCPQH